MKRLFICNPFGPALLRHIGGGIDTDAHLSQGREKDFTKETFVLRTGDTADDESALCCQELF